MMIHCPRCGFSQPKDSYCAQCGLDIENYKAPEVPFLKKIFSNPVFQLSIVLLVALASGLYVYKHNRQEIHERVSFFRQGIQYNRSLNTSRPPQNDSSATEGQSSDDSELPGELVTNDEPSGATGSAVPLGSAASTFKVTPLTTADTVTAKLSRIKIRIQYVEVNEGVLAQIYSESRASGQFNSLGDHVAGIWPQGKKKIATLRGWQLRSKEEKPFDEGSTLQFFAGLRGNDPENDLGFTTYMEVTGVDLQGLHGHLEVVRAWRDVAGTEPNSTIQRRFYPASIDLAADSYFFIAGALPRGTGMDNDPYLTNIEPFKLLKNKNRSTEFLIVVDFEKDSQ